MRKIKLFQKDIIYFKKTEEMDDLYLYEEIMNISLNIENNTPLMKFLYSNCDEYEEEDLFVEMLEIKDFISDLAMTMLSKKIWYCFPNVYYYTQLMHKCKNPKKLLKKFIKTTEKVNKFNEKSATKNNINYDI